MKNLIRRIQAWLASITKTPQAESVYGTEEDLLPDYMLEEDPKPEPKPVDWDKELATRYGDSVAREDITQKVIVINPQDTLKIVPFALISAWRGSGHMEWEAYWATYFLAACRCAVETGRKADISLLFQQDYHVGPTRVFTAEQTKKHLLKPFFDIISDTPECMEIRIKVAND